MSLSDCDSKRRNRKVAIGPPVISSDLAGESCGICFATHAASTHRRETSVTPSAQRSVSLIRCSMERVRNALAPIRRSSNNLSICAAGKSFEAWFFITCPPCELLSVKLFDPCTYKCGSLHRHQTFADTGHCYTGVVRFNAVQQDGFIRLAWHNVKGPAS